MTDIAHFIEYKETVVDAIAELIEDGEKFFFREDPNYQITKNAYETRWQVGIGNEKQGAIDHQIAKTWDRSIAFNIAEDANKRPTLTIIGMKQEAERVQHYSR